MPPGAVASIPNGNSTSPADDASPSQGSVASAASSSSVAMTTAARLAQALQPPVVRTSPHSGSPFLPSYPLYCRTVLRAARVHLSPASASLLHYALFFCFRRDAPKMLHLLHLLYTKLLYVRIREEERRRAALAEKAEADAGEAQVAASSSVSSGKEEPEETSARTSLDELGPPPPPSGAPSALTMRPPGVDARAGATAHTGPDEFELSRRLQSMPLLCAPRPLRLTSSGSSRARSRTRSHPPSSSSRAMLHASSSSSSSSPSTAAAVAEAASSTASAPSSSPHPVADAAMSLLAPLSQDPLVGACVPSLSAAGSSQLAYPFSLFAMQFTRFAELCAIAYCSVCWSSDQFPLFLRANAEPRCQQDQLLADPSSDSSSKRANPSPTLMDSQQALLASLDPVPASAQFAHASDDADELAVLNILRTDADLNHYPVDWPALLLLTHDSYLESLAELQRSQDEATAALAAAAQITVGHGSSHVLPHGYSALPLASTQIQLVQAQSPTTPPLVSPSTAALSSASSIPRPPSTRVSDVVLHALRVWREQKRKQRQEDRRRHSVEMAASEASAAAATGAAASSTAAAAAATPNVSLSSFVPSPPPALDDDDAVCYIPLKATHRLDRNTSEFDDRNNGGGSSPASTAANAQGGADGAAAAGSDGAGSATAHQHGVHTPPTPAAAAAKRRWKLVRSEFHKQRLLRSLRIQREFYLSLAKYKVLTHNSSSSRRSSLSSSARSQSMGSVQHHQPHSQQMPQRTGSTASVLRPLPSHAAAAVQGSNNNSSSNHSSLLLPYNVRNSVSLPDLTNSTVIDGTGSAVVDSGSSTPALLRSPSSSSLVLSATDDLDLNDQLRPPPLLMSPIPASPSPSLDEEELSPSNAAAAAAAAAAAVTTAGTAEPSAGFPPDELTEPRHPRLILMGGGMGSGKSTVLAALRGSGSLFGCDDAVVVEADKFKMADPLYLALPATDPSRAVLVHSQSLATAEETLLAAVRDGRDVIVDGTMSWRPYVEQTIAMVRQAHLKRFARGPGFQVNAATGEVMEQYWVESPPPPRPTRSMAETATESTTTTAATAKVHPAKGDRVMEAALAGMPFVFSPDLPHVSPSSSSRLSSSDSASSTSAGAVAAAPNNDDADDEECEQWCPPSFSSYVVCMLGVTVAWPVAVTRAVRRAVTMSRAVPIDKLLNSYSLYASNFDAYTRLVDAFMLWENSADTGGTLLQGEGAAHPMLICARALGETSDSIAVYNPALYAAFKHQAHMPGQVTCAREMIQALREAETKSQQQLKNKETSSVSDDSDSIDLASAAADAHPHPAWEEQVYPPLSLVLPSSLRWLLAQSSLGDDDVITDDDSDD